MSKHFPTTCKQKEGGNRQPTFAVTLIAVLLVLGSVAVSQVGSAEVREITSALRVRDFDNALQMLQPALQRNPNNSQLWTLQGIAYLGKSQKQEALQAFRHALSLTPNYLPALEGAAQIQYDNGGKDAEELLRHVLTLQPGNPTSHAMLAVLAYRRRDCASALTHFEQSGSLVDLQPGALQAFGECLVRLKQTDKAITIFDRALSQTPDDPTVRYRLASVQMIAQHPKDAITTLEPLLQANTKDANVLDLAAAAYEADGNTPEAVRILREAILVDPHNVNLYVDFTNLCIDHQSFDVGVDMINAGLKVEPNSAPLYVARGILYVQMAQFENAESDFEKADAVDPKGSIGSAAEGLAAVQQNDPDQALKTVRTKLAKNPNDAFLLYLKAEIITEKGPEPDSREFGEALSAATKSVSLRPSFAQGHDILAKLYLQQGRTQLAIEQSRQALKVDPKDQTAVYHLIQALRKSGQKSEVPELLKKLADLRTQATKDEAEHNRYKLVEQKSATTEKPQS
jgi:tetratricopeptide (TPR) repeat protein